MDIRKGFAAGAIVLALTGWARAAIVTLSTGPDGPILLSGGSPVTENFDTLATSGAANTTLPHGWGIAERGSDVTPPSNFDGKYEASSGTDNTGNVYSFGATSSTERALGGIQSGSVNPSFG